MTSFCDQKLMFCKSPLLVNLYLWYSWQKWEKNESWVILHKFRSLNQATAAGPLWDRMAVEILLEKHFLLDITNFFSVVCGFETKWKQPFLWFFNISMPCPSQKARIAKGCKIKTESLSYWGRGVSNRKITWFALIQILVESSRQLLF